MAQYNAMPENFGKAPSIYDPMAGLDFQIDPQAGGATEGGGLFDGFSLFGGKDDQGNQTMGGIGSGLSAITGIANLALGYKQYGLAKKELAFQQDQARINNQNQMTTLNNLMRGQAENRRIAAGGVGPTGEEYVQKHGVVAK